MEVDGLSAFGDRISNAGDVNNDGYDDVIVGAFAYSSDPNFSTFKGRAYIYYGGSTMDDVADLTITGEGDFIFFAQSLSGIGDVNGDGYDDVIVSANGYNNSTGRAYIYYGGSGMDNIPDVIMNGEAANNAFGFSVSNAGDVNNDGYNDVIVGAPGYNSSTGRAYIYYGGSGMDNIADIMMTGGTTNDGLGVSVSAEVDVNNDLYDDVIAGAFGYNSFTGQAYIYYGGSSMDNIADVIMTGEGTNNYFGYSVSGVNDVNNDGYHDVVVGATEYDSSSGRAYLYFGGSSMDNVADVIMTGEGANNYFSWSISGVGDVNNDGYNDLVVGANGYNNSTGCTYIYFGGSSMDNIADATITGLGINYAFGRSVGAGDVNNDGFIDLIVGASGYNNNTGKSYIYFGGITMDYIADVKMFGEGVNVFGFTVSNAGDVNGDGYDDVIVGAEFYRGAIGRAYIYFGGSSMDNEADVILTGTGFGNNHFGYSVSEAGDVNNDGYDDVVIGEYNSSKAHIFFGGSSMDNIPDITMSELAWGDWFGQSVSNAGDVNGDGYDDVIVSALGYNLAQGRVFIYLGGSSMDNIADIIMDGVTTNNWLGSSVSGAGDVNNDGYGDIIIGAAGANQAYIYYGASNMDNIADVTMIGVDGFFGYSVSGAGDVNNDGYDDAIVGADNTGRASIYFGNSNMDNTPDVTITGAGTNNSRGASVSDAGDVNNDGYGDVIVYALSNGQAYIYYGGSNMDNIADVTMTGERDPNHYCEAVSTAGDVNGDGYDDVIFGVWNYPLIGKAYIYSDNSAPLPVELASFTAKVISDKVQLNWSTATEINNYGFEIERKTESDWKKIGFAQGNGNSNSPEQYSFTDNNLMGGSKFQYRLKQIDNDGQFEYSEIVEVEVTPNEYALYQNYPNPFNPSTKIEFSIPEDVNNVTLTIYNALGQRVAELVNSKMEAGKYSYVWNADEVATGLYIYELRIDKFVSVKKMILLK
jgi:hypothetical protein